MLIVLFDFLLFIVLCAAIALSVVPARFLDRMAYQYECQDCCGCGACGESDTQQSRKANRGGNAHQRRIQRRADARRSKLVAV